MASGEKKLNLEEKLRIVRETFTEQPIGSEEQAEIIAQIQVCFKPIVERLVGEICAAIIALQRFNRELAPIIAHDDEGAEHIITIRILPVEAA